MEDFQKEKSLTFFQPSSEMNEKQNLELGQILKFGVDTIMQGKESEQLFNALETGKMGQMGFIAHSAISGMMRANQQVVSGNLYMQHRILRVLELVVLSQDQFQKSVLEINKQNHELVKSIKSTLDEKMKECTKLMSDCDGVWTNQSIPDQFKMQVWNGKKEMLIVFMEKTLPMCYESLQKMAGNNILDTQFINGAVNASKEIIKRMLESVDKISELNVGVVEKLGNTLVKMIDNKFNSPKQIKGNNEEKQEEKTNSIN